MKLLGGKWSRGDILALVGLIAAVLAVPGMPKLFHWDSESSTSFRKAAVGDLSPNSDTCLDGARQVIPGGTEVCVSMHGSWRDGTGPLGLCRRNAVTIWTRRAYPPLDELTSKHAYQHLDRFQETMDYVVCVRPPETAERTTNSSDRMGIDVFARPWPRTLGDCAPAEVVPCPK